MIFESLSTELVCLAELVPVTDVEEATTHCAEMMVAAVKIICHNICCRIQETHELGIDPKFGAVTPR